MNEVLKENKVDGSAWLQSLPEIYSPQYPTFKFYMIFKVGGTSFEAKVWFYEHGWDFKARYYNPPICYPFSFVSPEDRIYRFELEQIDFTKKQRRGLKVGFNLIQNELFNS